MARKNRRNGRKAKSSPLIYTLEDESLATADTAISGAFYTPTLSNSSLVTTQFTLRSAEIVVKAGSSTNRVFAIIRKVPDGYANPAITVTDAITVFKDMPNVLAYGLVQVYASTTDAMNRIALRVLKRTMLVHPGDSIVVQIVSDTSSAGQTISGMIEFAVAT
jgi:hypothetical protein